MSSLPPRQPYALTPLYFVLVLGAGLWGFYPSYLSQLRETDLSHHAHGLTAFAWMLMLISQATLIRLHRRALHRRVGKLAYVLAPLFIAAGLWMTWQTAHPDNPFSRRFGPRLVPVDLSFLLGFAVAFGLAIKHRRDIHRHARYMAVTGLLILPPALARLAPQVLPVRGFELAFHIAYFATEAVTAVLIAVSWRLRQPVLPFVLLMALLVLQQLGFWAGFSWTPG
ncbi:MAG TPA: hypothetical protein VIN03_02850 [Roseateles sp.]